jgi:predicted nucleic acid-binding protein
MALRAVLDTRFFFVYFNPASTRQAEWCKSMVLEALKQGSLLIASTITISELYETMGRLIGKDVVKIRIASIKAKNIHFTPVDEPIATRAGNIKLVIPEIPLADAIIAATAETYTNSLVLTDDPHFQKIEGMKTQWIE